MKKKTIDTLSQSGVILKEKCLPRTAYHRHLATQATDKKEWLATLKTLSAQYAVYFHDFLHEKKPYLLFEKGEDGVYWNYNTENGIYEELPGTIVRGIIIDLLFKEQLAMYATESFAKDILARFRAQYSERGVKYDDFDTSDVWFHCKNGWVHTMTREFEDHTPARLSRRISAVVFQKDALCPTYDTFLDIDMRLAADQIQALDQFSGLILTPDISRQKMLTIIGRPGCGKSTLVEVWMKILGDCATEKKLTALTGDSYRFAGSDLVGKTMCWFDEVDVKRAEMGSNLINLITGANILVERKGVNGIVRAKNRVKCILTANNLPRSVEAGAYRRMLLLPVENSFSDSDTADHNMANKLATEMSGIFNRMLRGLSTLKSSGFVKIEGHEDIIEDYKIASDPIAEFLDTYFEPAGEEFTIDTSVLFIAYKEFMGVKNQVYEKTCRQFGRAVASQSLIKFKSIKNRKRSDKNIRCWAGLTLKNEYEIVSEFGMIREKSTTIF